MVRQQRTHLFEAVSDLLYFGLPERDNTRTRVTQTEKRALMFTQGIVHSLTEWELANSYLACEMNLTHEHYNQETQYL